MASTSYIDQSIIESDDDFDDISDNVTTDESDEELSEAEESDIVVNPVWCDRTCGPKEIPFTGENKILFPFPEDAKPIDYFNVLVDNIFLESVVRETNRYALDFFLAHVLNQSPV